MKTLTWRFWLKLLGLTAGFAAFLAFLVGSWFYGKLQGSLPLIDGKAALAGLLAPVQIDRDDQGVPTIKASRLEDAAKALGYAHAQDRLFQMDLSRRRPAGELAELFGSAAVGLDKEVKLHRFRKLAQAALARATPPQRAVLEAYTAGVNAGIASLRVKPFEYIVLRVKPEPWKPEDCFLVRYAMTLTLQDDAGQYLQTLNQVKEQFGTKALDFFSPLVGPDDAALDGSRAPLPPPPTPDKIDLRKPAAISTSESESPVASASAVAGVAGPGPGSTTPATVDHAAVVQGTPGSNVFAVAGTRGAPAVLANDMHLALQVPNTWYRASLEWPDHKVTGVTLPGTPAIVAGSNGHIAWGFSNSETGVGDLLTVKSDFEGYYRGPNDQEAPMETRRAVIHVKGGDDEIVEAHWTAWGPVVATEGPGQMLVYHWTEDDASVCDLGILALVDAKTVADGLAIAHRCGIPNQNFVVADESGQIGWTIAGNLPARVGYNGRWPVSWSYGDRKWTGFVPAAEVPAVTGRDYIWAANQRMLGGAELEKLGSNGSSRPARAGQIEADLKAIVAKGAPIGPKDLLGVALDDRADMLAWWQQLALTIEDNPAIRHWGGHAAVDSVGYSIVRRFHDAVAARVFTPIFEPCVAADSTFDWTKLNSEPALRELVQAKPMHLLAPAYPSWEALLKAALADAKKRSTPWGKANTLRIVHPFSHVLPGFLTSWLNMPAEAVAGDNDMPRVMEPAFGASERFAVSPGHEDQGIFEMPCGESGHPLSPFYKAGHEAWVHGDPTPFLPGPTKHVLILASR